jgi:hypothetical protein
MVSWDFLNWLEIYGSELPVKYDIGLEFSGVLHRRFHPERRFELQLCWMSGSERSRQSRIMPRQIGEHWPTFEDSSSI